MPTLWSETGAGRVAAGLGLAAAFAFAGWSSLSRGLAWQAWERGLQEQGPAFLLEVEPNRIPREAAAYRQLAHSLGTELVPPQREEALGHLRQAIARDPQRADLWILASRLLFFTGRRDEARVALARSDAMNPSFPLQRLRAVQMWEMMGERDRAVGIALRVAALDNEGKREAAEALRLLGHSPVDAFVAVGGPDMEPGPMLRVLEVLRSTRASSMEALLLAVPDEAWRDAEFARRAARWAEDPVLPAVARKLWALAEPDLVDLPLGPEGPELPLANIDLARDPFARPGGSFGWQRPEALRRVDWRWIPLEGGPDDPKGAIEFKFLAHSADPGRAVSWQVHRSPAPALPQGLVVRARVQAEPARRSEFRLRVAAAGVAAHSPFASTGTDGWQEIVAVLPPTQEPGILVLSLERRWRGSSSVENAAVRLGGFEFSLPAPPPPAEPAP